MEDLVKLTHDTTYAYMMCLIDDNKKVLESFVPIRESILNWMELPSNDENLLTITGSRKLRNCDGCEYHGQMFAYREADINCAFVVENTTQSQNYENALLKATQYFPKEWIWDSKIVKTRAGLLYFLIDNVFVGDRVTRISITFRLKNLHEKIETLMNVRAKKLFNTIQQHLVQIMIVRDAFLKCSVQNEVLQKLDSSDEKYTQQKQILEILNKQYHDSKLWCTDLALVE